MAGLSVRPLTSADRDWVRRFVRERWGSETVVGHQTVYRPAELPGFVAERNGAPVGLVTYQIAGGSCEIVTIDSLVPDQGIGTALVTRVRQEATAAGCRRLWVMTTNDNLNALRFYQKRGFRLTALRPGAVDRARASKPEIPPVGQNGIPLRDELDLEMTLTRDAAAEPGRPATSDSGERAP